MTKTGPRDDTKLAAIKLEWWPGSDWNKWPTSLEAARERTQRLLEEEQATIRDLQTKLGHERLAKDEALETVRQLETETRVFAHNQETAEVELAAERLARHNAEVALAEALEAGMEADGRLRQVIAASRFR